MTEPRARHRAKGTLQFTSSDLQSLLYAFGDNTAPSTSTSSSQQPQHQHQQPSSLPQTITTLDEILHTFILETCHAAALSASYSRRAKLKPEDFKFVLRHDERLLGRVLEQVWKERNMKEERRVMDFEYVGKEGVGGLEGIAQVGGVGGEVGRRKGGKRRRKGGAEQGGEGPRGKRSKSEEVWDERAYAARWGGRYGVLGQHAYQRKTARCTADAARTGTTFVSVTDRTAGPERHSDNGTLCWAPYSHYVKLH
ncbi:hypothetical protein LTR03_003795 [Friedmanniomyces endolithicus]|nr:hypothetical protein LTR03_003795 [Friedmanniomyces endolithicus]